MVTIISTLSVVCVYEICDNKTETFLILAFLVIHRPRRLKQEDEELSALISNRTSVPETHTYWAISHQATPGNWLREANKISWVRFESSKTEVRVA